LCIHIKNLLATVIWYRIQNDFRHGNYANFRCKNCYPALAFHAASDGALEADVDAGLLAQQLLWIGVDCEACLNRKQDGGTTYKKWVEPNEP
jgi:hypothetical protein